MTKTQSVWKDLVISMLAVNNYTLEKVDAYSAELEAQGLLEPQNLAKFSHEEIFTRLDKAKYKRGNMNDIFTQRLLSLGEFVQARGLIECEKILLNASKEKISEFLKQVKGVGPKVLENFFELRGLNS